MAAAPSTPPAGEALHYPLMADTWNPVATDFLKDDLSKALIQAGFDTDAPCIFIAEGFLMYLDLDSLTRLLRSLAELSAGGQGTCEH